MSATARHPCGRVAWRDLRLAATIKTAHDASVDQLTDGMNTSCGEPPREGLSDTAISFRLTEMMSNGGDTVAFPDTGVTCIVGGNNVGKSQLLREIADTVGNESAQRLVLRNLQVFKSVAEEESAARFLENYGVQQRGAPGQEPTYLPRTGGGQNLSVGRFVQHFNSSSPAFNQVRQYFVWYASAGALSGLASGGVSISDTTAHPLVALYQDGTLEEELSNLALEAFGIPLTLDRIGGPLRLLLGEVSVPIPPLNRPNREYARAVAGLDPLAHQGDGIRSYVGLLLYVLAAACPVVIIDEPEAFLHPGQARSLGRWLGNTAVARGMQIVIATHDRDLCVGLLDSGISGHLNFVRITRSQNVNRLRAVPPGDLAQIWSDPVLRYSNLLQGLFHRTATICEGDADCRFFGAVLDELASELEARSSADEVLFVPSGGKQRVAAMIEALMKFGVDTRAILDFDILRNRSDLRAIVAAKGGTWTDEMDSNYVAVSRYLNSGSLWDTAKNAGMSALRAGAVYVAAESLLQTVRDMGIYVIPLGEMEDFDKSISGHGAQWVSEMLAQRRHVTCEPARELVATLLEPHP